VRDFFFLLLHPPGEPFDQTQQHRHERRALCCANVPEKPTTQGSCPLAVARSVWPRKFLCN
jgi:hypothetical protein